MLWLVSAKSVESGIFGFAAMNAVLVLQNLWSTCTSVWLLCSYDRKHHDMLLQADTYQPDHQVPMLQPKR